MGKDLTAECCFFLLSVVWLAIKDDVNMKLLVHLLPHEGNVIKHYNSLLLIITYHRAYNLTEFTLNRHH